MNCSCFRNERVEQTQKRSRKVSSSPQKLFHCCAAALIRRRKADLSDSNRLDDLENRWAAHDEQEEGEQPRPDAHFVIAAFLKREGERTRSLKRHLFNRKAVENCAAFWSQGQSSYLIDNFLRSTRQTTRCWLFLSMKGTFCAPCTVNERPFAVLSNRKPTSRRVYTKKIIPPKILTVDLGTLPLRVMFLLAFSLATLILCVGAIFSRGISWLLQVGDKKCLFDELSGIPECRGRPDCVETNVRCCWSVHVSWDWRNGVVPFFYADETLPKVTSTSDVAVQAVQQKAAQFFWIFRSR